MAYDIFFIHLLKPKTTKTMKKQTLLFLAISFIISFGVKADPATVTVTIDHVIEQPGTVSIPVHFDIDVDEPGVGSIELLIDYDTSVLTEFKGFKNIASEIEDTWVELAGVDSQDPGELKINTNANNEDDYLESFSGVLFEIEFEYAGQYSDITFEQKNEDGGSEIGGGEDTSGDAIKITADFVNGSITQAPSIPIALWSVIVGFGLISLFTLKRAARKP